MLSAVMSIFTVFTSEGGGCKAHAPDPIIEAVYAPTAYYQAEENPIIIPADDDEDLIYLSKTVWGEAGAVKDREIQAAVAWTVLNRVDSPLYPDSVKACVSQRLQYTGFHEWYLMPWEKGSRIEGLDNRVVTSEVVELCREVLVIWLNGFEGRNIPEDYFGFDFDANRNITFFKNKRSERERWNFTIISEK